MNQTGLDFGNTTTGFVSGQVYNDLNGDGSNDGGTDPGLQGWTVTARGCGRQHGGHDR